MQQDVVHKQHHIESLDGLLIESREVRLALGFLYVQIKQVTNNDEKHIHEHMEKSEKMKDTYVFCFLILVE